MLRVGSADPAGCSGLLVGPNVLTPFLTETQSGAQFTTK